MADHPFLRSALVLSLTLLLGCPEPDEVEPEPPTPSDPGPENPWNEGPYGEGVMDYAEDFDFPTADGDWDFEDQWTGEDSYVFLQRQPYAYSEAMWGGDMAEMLEESAPNTHYFFVSARVVWEEDLAEIQASIDGALESMSEEDAAWWGPRLHVTNVERGEVNGLVEAVLESDWATWGFAIDRFQRIRELGLLQFVCDGCTGDLWFLAHPGRYYNFEYERERFLAANPPDLEIELWNEFQMEGGGVNAVIDLPDVSAYDTLEVDLTMGCVGHTDDNCFEWDYKARMDICETEVDKTEPPKTCTPEELDAEGNVVVPAETLPCSCSSGYDGIVQRERTCQAVTDEEGNVSNEFSACPCSCGHSIARWITPYHREGRWVTDITPMLGWMQQPGATRIHANLAYPFLVSSTLRFSNRGKGLTPFAVEQLWGGGNFNSDYNASHADITFTPPEGAVAAKLVALITGHGFAGDAANCAEFCPHSHSFQLNAGEWHTREFDEARDWLGCAVQVDDGAVPNQFGTWYLGRGGWCPGMDVPPVVFDLSADLLPGVENTLSYHAGLDGNDPDNHGSIWMDSYLVFYR